jgi:superfamily I DNA and RNA helicase
MLLWSSFGYRVLTTGGCSVEIKRLVASSPAEFPNRDDEDRENTKASSSLQFDNWEKESFFSVIHPLSIPIGV